MNVATASARTMTAPTRALHGVIDAWRAVTVEQVGLAALLGVAALAQVLVRALNQTPATVLAETVNAQLGAFALLAAVVVADGAVDRGASRLAAYGVAVGVGAVVGVAAQLTYLQGFWDVAANEGSAISRLVTKPPHPLPILGLLIEWLIIDALAVYVYADRREARRMTARLHAAELQRNAQARRVLESQLQTMQARIEPRFLFDTLAQVKRLYELDATLAQRMLDDLIDYLRAAMPRMRDTSSTLAQEIELASAYLSIVGARSGSRLGFDIDVPEGRNVRMAPMVLLPLIDQALSRSLQLAAIPRSILIRARIADGTLRLAIIDSGTGFLPETAGDEIHGLRERLIALYGEAASLELRHGQRTSTEAVLTIPYEAIDGTDR
jgi:hypothetical protein